MSLEKPVGTIFGHPKGLFLLFGTEMWERFSYYGMRAILVLYLVALTESGGMGWSNSDALSLYGTYTFLVYVTPLFGGWLADNVLGQRKSIIIGGLLMAAGQFTLGVPHEYIISNEMTFFYTGLALLIIGNGMFKPNISTMVGDLYKEGDHRRDGAFTIFYMGINLGAAIAPLIVGTIAEKFEWQYGFIAAGIGMLMSIILQVSLGNKYLGDIGIEPAVKQSNTKGQAKKESLTKIEFDRIKVIFIMSAFTIIFWAGFEQGGGLMNLFASEYTDRWIMNFEVPASWFQSVSAIFIVILAPSVASCWIKMDHKEPTSPVKFALALIFLAIGFLFMIGATMQQGGDITVKTSMMWLIMAYLFHTLGELCLSPIGLSMVTKLAPLRLASVMMGIWFFFTGMANYVAGYVGSFIGESTESANNAMVIFAGIAITATLSAVIIYLLSDRLVYWMHGAEGVHQPQKHEGSIIAQQGMSTERI
ncbi:proton-dependent oligopeptide transporter, POT family [Pseudoalteromonas translucida KMM 520]|uniref:Proton-dependent oligopeptide transporter, POT family n=1 Tax=Pseudoalteromonas translucida KMM 520 TaxID=1315283 RepID=A0A0U2WN80_9GAMM|nr:peptide MFS transporter [Pseudoalteromonas translucida]ALS34810.1 proton-dependent oligopeptide transporter, POT family [Pseudoalteromonas translucida KMM 520]